MNRQFGALNGIAIILIVLNHAINMTLSPPIDLNTPSIAGWQRDILSILQALGVFAVPIFLFISGSFIAYAARGEPPKLSSKFLITSLKHILFPYIFWSILFYVLIYFHYDQSFSLFGYIKNLLVGYPFHFIPLLTFFYIISPILVRIGKTHGLLLILVIAFYQLLLLNIVKPGILGFVLPEWSRYFALPILRNTMADWAIYFPLGLVYGLHTKTLLPKLMDFQKLLGLLAVIFFILGIMEGIFGKINFPISRYITMTLVILIVPTIKRDSIPFVRPLEKIGRRSYGIYLTHLLIIDLSLAVIQTTMLGLYNLPIIITFVLFLLGIFIPLGFMELTSIAPTKRYYRYIFG